MGLRSAESVSAPVLPSLDSLIEGVKPETVTEAKAPEPKENEGALERIEREQKHRRELFALQKRNKELEEKYRNTSDQASVLNSKNPIKDLAKAKNLTQDEIVKMALEAMDDNLSTDEKKDDLKQMSPQEIAKLVKDELDKEKQTTEKSEKELQAIASFKQDIVSKAKELVDQYPLVDGLNGSEAVFSLIDAQYKKDVEEYGAEYAAENLMTVDDAIKKTNETLALNIKDALKSKHLRDFVLKTIKEDGGEYEKPDQSQENVQLKDQESFTMTNKSHRPATEAGGRPKFNSDQDELDYLINKLT